MTSPYMPEPSAAQNPILAEQHAHEIRGAWGRPRRRKRKQRRPGLIARLWRALAGRRSSVASRPGLRPPSISAVPRVWRHTVRLGRWRRGGWAKQVPPIADHVEEDDDPTVGLISRLADKLYAPAAHSIVGMVEVVNP